MKIRSLIENKILIDNLKTLKARTPEFQVKLFFVLRALLNELNMFEEFKSYLKNILKKEVINVDDPEYIEYSERVEEYLNSSILPNRIIGSKFNGFFMEELQENNISEELINFFKTLKIVIDVEE